MDWDLNFDRVRSAVKNKDNFFHVRLLRSVTSATHFVVIQKLGRRAGDVSTPSTHKQTMHNDVIPRLGAGVGFRVSE